MVNLTINKKRLSVAPGTSIMDAAKKIHIDIPSLCYLEDLNEIGACRVCVVEIEGVERLVTACNNTVEEDMVVLTNSTKVREARKTNVELILSQHDATCALCVRSGNCSLQEVATDLGIIENPYHQTLPHARWTEGFPLVRNYEKCIKCMRCIQVCDKIQDLHIWDIANTGSRTNVDVSGNLRIEESDCALCGQCITHCPVGALRERDDLDEVFEALADPDKITVVQIAPAVRAAWGEALGMDRDFATVKRLAAALRAVGFDYIFDTNFTADLTIMEEGSEFVKRLGNAENETFPMFTSCCPGWIRFIKSQYPDMLPQLSTAKSPQQMFGAIAKSYYAELMDVDPSKIYSVSIMPCLAKKYEANLPIMNDAEAGQDVDVVITTREVERLIRSENINVKSLDEEELDSPLGVGSGAAVIFGATGGVMEAALRSAYFLVTGENPSPDAFMDVRGRQGWKEAKFELAGTVLSVAVASGLANTRRLIEALRRNEVHYDFVEIMACPGGCAGGGGQPIWDGEELAGDRADVLYGLDSINNIRFSHENPSVQKCYENYLQKPLSHTSHKLLHTDHSKWELNPNKWE
jgi:NADP-reducing hydrogenase subunit HndD